MKKSGERKLEALQVLYRDLLLAALESCAKGRWGLFGHNDFALRDSPHLKARLADPAIEELLDCGEEIERIRRALGYVDAFALHERLLQLRSSHNANSPGEPKLAQQWLAELLA